MRAGAPGTHAGVMSNHTNTSCRPGGCAGLCSDDGLRAADTAFRPKLLAAARRVVVDPHLAEEAVQEALLRAWRSCCSFDPAGGPVLPWLVVLTRHAAIDMARARARRPPLTAYEPSIDGALGSQGTHEDHVVLRAELLDALADIGSEHRTVIVETMLRDRSQLEVATELGIPTGTLRSRSHYAMRQLRAVLVAARAAEAAV